MFKIENSNRMYTEAMPTYFVAELADLEEPFSVSISITNLLRLGFFNIIDGRIKNYDYESFKAHPYVQLRSALFHSFGEPFKIEISEKVLKLNDYGRSFAKVCLEKEV